LLERHLKHYCYRKRVPVNRPSAHKCINGVNDRVFPIADLHLLLEYGGPKAARFYPGGHMGGGDAQAVIVQCSKKN
jgi:hypothetical protein